MEKDPTHHHNECPNCGFELDLPPPIDEQTAKSLGFAALKGLKNSPQPIAYTPSDHRYGPVTAPGSDKNHELLQRLKRTTARKMVESQPHYQEGPAVLTENHSGLIIRPEEVDTHCLVVDLADIAKNRSSTNTE